MKQKRKEEEIEAAKAMKKSPKKAIKKPEKK